MPSEGSTTKRGYGSAHQALRRRYQDHVATGQATCWRCGRPIKPNQQWDLGHDDHDRTKYRGPEHARAKDCPAGGNRATKGRNKRSGPNAIYLVTGPPASGKSTWVREHARPGDITIDFDAIANVLTPPDGKPHKHTPAVQAITKAARQAAIDTALQTAGDHDVYIIHSMPSAATVQRYRDAGAQIVTIDPGQDVVMARCRAERPWQIQQAAKLWYRQQTPGATRQTPGHAPALGWFNGPAAGSSKTAGQGGWVAIEGEPAT
nr:AAA family ATPase [Mycobacterium dioxanotrophicus]